MTRGPRVLFYSHDGLGLGHTRRNLSLASALLKTCPDAGVLVATGTDDVWLLNPNAGVEILKLPGLRKVANGQYSARHLSLPDDDIFRLRRDLLTTACESFDPDVVVVDKHPLGAGGELRPALDLCRSRGAGTVLGLRDILDDPRAVAEEWAAYDLPAQITQYYDRVLVYGQREIFDPVSEYSFPVAPR